MESHDKILRQFEQATEEVVALTVKLTDAQARRDALRKRLKAALRNGHDDAATAGVDSDGMNSEAVMEAVTAVRNAGVPTDAKRLGEILGISTSIARTRLQRGAKAKLLRRLSRGKYEAEAAPVES